jgi:hypothetical protein
MRLTLILILAFAVISPVCLISVAAQADPDAQRIAKVKKDVNKIGVDERVNVRIVDGTVIKGRIKEIGDDYFVLIEKQTADSRMLRFAQVKQVRSVVDNPLSDPAVVLGLALIPVIIVAAVMSRGD